jgi:hypothetical protein
MKNPKTLVTSSLLLGLMMMASACVVTPHDGYREGYYDRDNHRYYHENGWHDCVDRDEHCH